MVYVVLLLQKLYLTRIATDEQMNILVFLLRQRLAFF
jgi:hypothetical protein